MPTIVSCVIRSLWYDTYTTQSMPVSYKYLYRLCSNSAPVTLQTRVISAIIIQFYHALDISGTTIDVENQMIIILFSRNDDNLAECRRVAIEQVKQLGEIFSFMLPHTLDCS